jgi:hypothetical protein
MSALPRLRIPRLWPAWALCATFMAAALTLGVTQPAGAVTPPTLHMTAGPFHNKQLIALSVGANHYFTPYSHVNILECADPGGTKKHLPNRIAACDGNTIQGPTVLINKNGSFSAHGYELFALPNRPLLGEEAQGRPICNQKNMCVLYVGQNQENFNAPKVFSKPFAIRSGTHS